MANVYVEARPKGRPRGPVSMIMWWRITRTMSSQRPIHNMKRSTGRGERATTLSSLVFDI